MLTGKFGLKSSTTLNASSFKLIMTRSLWRGDSSHEESWLPSEKIQREIWSDDDLIKYFLLHGGNIKGGVCSLFPLCGKFLEFSRVFHRFPTQTDIEHKARSKSGPPKGPLSPEVDTESRKSNIKWVEKSELLPTRKSLDWFRISTEILYSSPLCDDVGVKYF